MEFEYPEDREFFANLFADGDIELLEREFSDHFDFEHPAIKREAFNKIRHKILRDLLAKYGEVCQLRLHPDCSKEKIWEPDHIVPLSTNELNKKLRHMERTGPEKVPRQSFGSNNQKNLTLACRRCNAFKKHRIILPASFHTQGGLGFLEQYKVDHETVTLPSGEDISIQKYFLHFKPWSGEPLGFDFGRKPVLDFNGEACFAELAILRIFQQNNWDGAWVETYGGKHYLNSMPSAWKLNSDVTISADKEELITKIQKTGKTSASFDVVVWQGNKVLFIEAKRLKKDRLTDAQKRFIQGALTCGVPITSFIILEWDFKKIA